ncbi:AbrB/MazE/SpoVT family DNA-binding domain-containing protein [Spiribacter sp. 221]|uniref:AbrB/MazE/SpoVT family DNA-binding domain-containing protein n=1 Tax=Spiribacter onubensis TaxID=3122420 RepID=UPI00349F57FF
MPKVTSKLQVTLPKKIADAHGIHPGDQIDFESVGDVIRIRPEGADSGAGNKAKSPAERLRLFEEATRRQRAREQSMTLNTHGESPDREWTREALYDRVRSD